MWICGTVGAGVGRRGTAPAGDCRRRWVRAGGDGGGTGAPPACPCSGRDGAPCTPCVADTTVTHPDCAVDADRVGRPADCAGLAGIRRTWQLGDDWVFRRFVALSAGGVDPLAAHTDCTVAGSTGGRLGHHWPDGRLLAHLSASTRRLDGVGFAVPHGRRPSFDARQSTGTLCRMGQWPGRSHHTGRQSLGLDPASVVPLVYRGNCMADARCVLSSRVTRYLAAVSARQHGALGGCDGAHGRAADPLGLGLVCVTAPLCRSSNLCARRQPDDLSWPRVGYGVPQCHHDCRQTGHLGCIAPRVGVATPTDASAPVGSGTPRVADDDSRDLGQAERSAGYRPGAVDPRRTALARAGAHPHPCGLVGWAERGRAGRVGVAIDRTEQRRERFCHRLAPSRCTQ